MDENDLSEVFYKIRKVNARKMVEGVIETALVVGIIAVIPFVWKLKVALILLSAIGIMVINLVGFHGKSLLEAASRIIKAKSNKKFLCLGSPIDENKGNRIEYSQSANKYIQKAREYLSDENLERKDAGIPEKIIRGIKPYIINIKDTFGM